MVGRALRNNFAAVFSRAGAKVNHPISGADGFIIVLHHQDGVAQVAQAFQRVQQAAVIARVQADGRFVQNIEHPHQLGTDLGGQADALRLPAGEGAGAAFQGQIVQADIHQKTEAGLNFAQNALGDGFLAGIERRVFGGGSLFTQASVRLTGSRSHQ
jgi:hypothetical protein